MCAIIDKIGAILLLGVIWFIIYIIWLDETRQWTSYENEPGSEWKKKRNKMITILLVTYGVVITVILAL